MSVRGPIAVGEFQFSQPRLGDTRLKRDAALTLLSAGSVIVSWGVSDTYADSTALGGRNGWQYFFHRFNAFNYIAGSAAADRLTGTADSDLINGSAADDWLWGGTDNDYLNGGEGAVTLIGEDGNDTLIGGNGHSDLADVAFGGAGDDELRGGHGNDALRGDADDDMLSGGFGVDTVLGGAGNDQLTGTTVGDLLFGGDGNDFIDGSFGSDRANGGAGGDAFFHTGDGGHGSDCIQDFDGTQGDALVFGNGAATADQLQINQAVTENAGANDVAEAFVIYRPTGQILWALVDGAAQFEIMIRIDGEAFDLMM